MIFCNRPIRKMLKYLDVLKGIPKINSKLEVGSWMLEEYGSTVKTVTLCLKERYRKIFSVEISPPVVAGKNGYEIMARIFFLLVSILQYCNFIAINIS